MSPRLAQITQEFLDGGGTFEKIKLSECFTVKSNPQLDKEIFTFSEFSKYPYFTRTVFNNGIYGYVDYFDDAHLIKGNSIAVGMMGMQFFYMAHDFYAGQFTKTLFPKFNGLDADIALYFISILNLYQGRLKAELVRHFESFLLSQSVPLPTSNGEIDFDFIRRYIATLKAERLATLKAYLQAAGLSDTILTEGELAALDALRQNRMVWKPFSIGDIFDEPQSGDIDIQNRDINGKGCLFINSGVTNCGIKGRTDRDARTFPANSITIDFFGNAYYRSEKYKLATHNHVFSFTGDVIKNRPVGLFLIATMSYLPLIYSYGNMATKPTLKKNVLNLPVTDEGEIDFLFMENLISAQIKSAIKDILYSKDLEITTTAEIINNK